MLAKFVRKRVEKRSPIERRLLRRPGQSLLERQIFDIMIPRLGWCMFLLGAAGGVICWESIAWIAGIPRNPSALFALYTAAFAIMAVAWLWTKPMFRELGRLRLGWEGEELMGQLFVELRPHGYRAFHDLQGDGFNIDHVLVGPGGVFAIETKTVNKPMRGAGTVVHRADRVTVGGQTPDRDALVQARASARHVRDLVRRMTGREVTVRPVVIYPGWFVDGDRDSDVRVANEKYFVKAIVSEAQSWSEGDVRFVCAGLERHMREQDRERGKK